MVATVHATMMVIALVVYLISFGLRFGEPDRRSAGAVRAVAHRLSAR